MLAVVLVPSIVCILPEVSQLVIRHRWTGPGPLLADSSDVLRDVASTLVEEAGTLLGTVKSGCICRLHKLEPFRLRVLASAGLLCRSGLGSSKRFACQQPGCLRSLQKLCRERFPSLEGLRCLSLGVWLAEIGPERDLHEVPTDR